jgi:predicted nuclease of restriction endonuclease-like RecB superfamily
LTQKLERLRAAHLPNLIVCIDEDRQCGDGELPPDARIVRFRRRVDAAAVMREVARLTGGLAASGG